MKLSDRFWWIVDCVHSLFWSTKKVEPKFHRCQGFTADRIKTWRNNSGLSCAEASKVLESIEVLDGIRIRQLIAETVESRADIFNDENLFVTSFGESAKSGEVVFYDFRHTSNFDTRFKIINSSEIQAVPSRSRIVFVDDLIGTGRQSVEYIQERLFKMLAPSHRPALFSVCATPDGMEHVRANSAFDVFCAHELRPEECDHFNPASGIFSEREKAKLKLINEKLGRNDYQLGLLLAFYYGTPNNTMPFVWKDGFRYTKANGDKDNWVAILPRRY